MKDIVSKWGKHVVAIIVFLVLVVVYFSPAFLDGKALRQSDMEKADGMGNSQMEQYAKAAKPGEFSVWSDAMFGGMPYVSGYGNPAPELPGFQLLERPIKGVGYGDAAMVFAALLSFYLLMCIMGVNWWLALAGAFAFAFASYNMIIIAGGHITKAYVIAYMPVTLAGMVLLFRNKYLWGGVLFLLGVALSISNGHIQITYYLVLLCLFVYLGYLIRKIRQKRLKELGIVTAIMAACVVLAVLPNAKNMYTHWDLGKNSTRGATELTTTTASGEKISSGLDKDYAFQWSYGKMELLTLLIPNAYGGSSVTPLGADSEVHKFMRSKYQIGNEVQMPTFWGDKPFTQGPMYFGAIVCSLFIFGMFVIRSPMKWWWFAGAVFLTLMAFGRNFDVFNTFLFHYLPLNNKFRTVEMALALPGFVFPVIAIWGLRDLFTKEIDAKVIKRGLLLSFDITGAICLIVWRAPALFLDFSSSYDSPFAHQDWYPALLIDRSIMASADALRSLIFIILGAVLLYWYLRAKDKAKTATIVSAALAVLILVDLWGIDRRYLNEGNFYDKKKSETYKSSLADQAILQDKDLSYRVLNLNNPFEETTTSYYHHSLGGYHAAKLRRYQELIDHRLRGEITSMITSFQSAKSIEDLHGVFDNTPTINMLNTRYLIFNPGQPPLVNPHAMGNAWFVGEVKIVENADAEIEAMNTIHPLQTAVVDKRFADQLAGFTPQPDSTATIELTTYHPGKLTYKTSAATEQLAVFSEIYYNPGWNVYIDGKPATHLRADWTLRAMRVPAGQHEIVFEFRPEMFVRTAYIESISSFLILLLILGVAGYSIVTGYRQRKAAM